VNIIELTGNHLLDKGNQAFESTLTLFSEEGFNYYAGGYTEDEAINPLVIEHNGNKVAFIGCNLAGPANVWVGMERSGVAYCDFDAMESQIQNLAQNGYLPIVTFQYFESNFTKPSAAQVRDFRSMIDSGAIIVSGSQSHVPMTMEIYQNGFIHYGLGNLFFDQMDNLSNRKEFIDRHIFYNGKYISTELLTAKLEDYAKPVPMTDAERADLLNEAFGYFTYSVEEE
jgi:poly-gamma-glutamate synthesis protein (capsule biosynthesis protein)